MQVSVSYKCCLLLCVSWQGVQPHGMIVKDFIGYVRQTSELSLPDDFLKYEKNLDKHNHHVMWNKLAQEQRKVMGEYNI